jgi:transcriptional regulator with XRE-family HTH domain
VPGQHKDLKRALRAARSQAGYESDNALALAAGVHLQTLQNWMYGKTTPRPSELSKVAKVLDKPLDYFMAIYEGRQPEEQPLHETVRELTDAVRELVAEMREERERGQDAAAAILRAAGALRPNNGGAPASRERPVPDGSRG